MEPVTAVAIGYIILDTFGKPILDEAKTQYAQKVLEKLDAALAKLPFRKKELEIIEAEIVKADKDEVFKDEKSLIEFFKNNQNINEVIKQLNQREPNINIKVKKGVGYINENHGDISF